MAYKPARKKPIPVHPQISRLISFIWFHALFAALPILLAVDFLAESEPYPVTPSRIISIVMLMGTGIWMSLLALRFFLRLSRLKRLEPRRFRAATSARTPLDGQPLSPDPSDSFLPFTITFRLKRRLIFFWTTIVYLIYIGGWLFLAHEIVFLPFLTGFFISLGLFFIPLLAFFQFQRQSLIEVTEEGIKVVDKGNTITQLDAFVAWQDARLFACYADRNPLKSSNTINYELSSPDAIVLWFWIKDPQAFFSPWKPSLPNAEYQQRMQQLINLVPLKSGLPFSDLDHPLEANPSKQSEKPVA